MKPESTSDKPPEDPPEPGMLTYFLQFFGSLKLAMILLATMIGACVVGTLVESHLDTAVAQTYIYDAPWFIGWLVLLCLNLICSALVRYPWKPHLTGFVITHAGIVTILIGAIIGRIWGVEGHITLSKVEDPVNYIVLPQKLLEVRTSRMKESQFQAVPVDVRPPSPERPILFNAGGVKVAVLGYAEELGVKTQIEEGDKDGSPAIQFVMQSAMIGKPVEQWLVLNDPERGSVDLGPAVIRLAKSGPIQKANNVNKQTSPEECREVHFAFAKMPEMSVARQVSGGPTGVKAVYRFEPSVADEAKNSGILSLEADGRKFDFPVSAILGRPTLLKGTPWTLKIINYFADFRMQDKEPVSISDQPNNPALVFEIVGKAVRQAAVSAAGSTEAMVHGHAHGGDPASISGKNTMTIYYNPDGKMHYTAVSKTKGTTTGEIEMGTEFSLGWADWKFKVLKSVRNAAIREELAPLSEGPYRPLGSPGVKVRIEGNGGIDTRWVAMATPVHFHLGDESIHLNFGQRLHPLNFDMALEDFEVQRDEGTQNPAGFKSHVRFVDAKNGVTMQREIWMNHPATFPDFPGAALLGTSYKFSQASWNPNDLNQTTLQVLRDPGWSFKWIGSLMLCGGIFTMFYIKPYLAPPEEKKS